MKNNHQPLRRLMTPCKLVKKKWLKRLIKKKKAQVSFNRYHSVNKKKKINHKNKFKLLKNNKLTQTR